MCTNKILWFYDNQWHLETVVTNVINQKRTYRFVYELFKQLISILKNSAGAISLKFIEEGHSNLPSRKRVPHYQCHHYIFVTLWASVKENSFLRQNKLRKVKSFHFKRYYCKKIGYKASEFGQSKRKRRTTQCSLLIYKRNQATRLKLSQPVLAFLIFVITRRSSKE